MMDFASGHGRHTAQAHSYPHIRSVGTERPWVWLAAGWADMMATPVISFGFGILATLSSVVLVLGLAMNDLHYLILPMAAGFLLIGPLCAVGLYEASRLTENGEQVTFAKVVGAYHRNGAQIAGIGLVLALAFLAWIRIAFLIFAVFFSADPPSFELLVERVFFSEQTIPFLLTGTIVGAFIAAVVFAIAAVSIPMLLDRDVDTITAVVASVHAVQQNPRAMLTWAGLVALFTIAGMATAFIGLAIALPLLGHATWHCYRDVIGTGR